MIDSKIPSDLRYEPTTRGGFFPSFQYQAPPTTISYVDSLENVSCERFFFPIPATSYEVRRMFLTGFTFTYGLRGNMEGFLNDRELQCRVQCVLLFIALTFCPPAASVVAAAATACDRVHDAVGS